MPLDYALFAGHMETEDPHAILLKGHLWIESRLNAALEVLLLHPDAINVDRMPVSQKINLTFALGFLDEGEAATLRLFNRMRNRLAHELAGEPSESDFIELQASLDGTMKSAWEAAIISEDRAELTSHSLVAWLYTVLMVLEYKTMMRRYERDHHQALSTYRLLLALDDRRGVSTPDIELREKCGVPPEPDPRDAWINDQDVVSSRIRFVETHR